ncbi:hypothetical protein, partial [Stutzerimonas stutzeri]|uniref:hypothetical protein n=1 Tax=Stutzerimonas stutzeri TaxID=316 RepID=UPI001CA53A5A
TPACGTERRRLRSAAAVELLASFCLCFLKTNPSARTGFMERLRWNRINTRERNPRKFTMTMLTKRLGGLVMPILYKKEK